MVNTFVSLCRFSGRAKTHNYQSETCGKSSSSTQAESFLSLIRVDPGGGVLPYKRLIGMCRWMGSHFHDWSDYNGVAFLIDLLEWGRKFSDFGGK